MNSRRVGCLVSFAVTAVLAGGACLILTSAGDRETVNADLILAAKLGNADEIKSLLNRGADPNTQEIHTSETPPGDLLDRIARLFRRRDAIGEAGDSALTAAVHSLHRYEAARVLIQHGARVNTGLLNGAENVHDAARSGDAETVNLLIEHGAGVKMPPNHFTDLRTDMLMLLAAHGAAVPPPADAQHVRTNPICYDIPLSDRDRQFLTAINRDDIDAVRRLLTAGEDYYVTDKDGASALDIAAYKGFRDLLEMFVQHGADVNDMHDDINMNYRTPLLYALENRANVPGRLETVRFLLEHGADANYAGGHQKSAMNLVKSGKLNDSAAIETLLKAHGGLEKGRPRRLSRTPGF